MQSNRVLVVDDEQLITWSFAKTLEKAGYKVEVAGSGAAARQKFLSFHPHLILLDVSLPDANGLDLLQEFKAQNSDIGIIVITASAHADSAVQAFKLGAEDYIGKPFNMETVKHTIFQVLEKKRLKREVDVFRRGLRKKFEFDQLIGNCPQMVEVFKTIQVCAESDCRTVLILGESGTGKELAARAIHEHSGRAQEPFIEVNCAAIPENLLENELFGHEKGAYTDASNKEKGIFEMAEGGTVFLDEIGDMPLAMQAKVLKVIETKRFRRLGGREDLKANVRIIAATNQNLQRMVREGTFRGDLFYRLNLMCVNLPPRRERKEDIPHIVQYFIRRLNDEYGRAVSGISSQAMELLLHYNWPGNVRELRNAIERAMMFEHEKILTPAHLPCEIRLGPDSASNRDPAPHRQPVAAEIPVPTGLTLPAAGISMEEVEKLFIRQALARYGGNQTKAARCLGMSRDTLRYRMKKFAIDDPHCSKSVDAGHGPDAMCFGCP